MQVDHMRRLFESSMSKFGQSWTKFYDVKSRPLLCQYGTVSTKQAFKLQRDRLLHHIHVPPACLALFRFHCTLVIPKVYIRTGQRMIS